MENEWVVGVCREGHRGVFGIFLSGISVPGEGSGIGWKGFKKLFIDRLRGERVVVLAANRRGFMRWFGGIVDINIALIRYFLRMNEKDVLGARPASGNVQKMESVPHWAKSRFCAKSGIYFNWIKCLFCHFLGRELFLFFQYVYSADFCRELNLQISCIFVAFDIKKISNVAHATFCKVFSLYTNYAILYILYSIHQKPQYLVSIYIVQYRTIHNI